ncbi:MAG: U32 family peptidase, partial [Clostridiales bacterium]|nr:U32 family peptidase [Clostridiales bacterium]
MDRGICRDNRIELLAPAGSPAILRAVVAAGADAVYFGGMKFGARAYADNFSDGELLEAIDYAHLHGRRAYVTVNTLLKNDEMAQLYDYVRPLYERGVDAVLVQDLGVLDFLRTEFPDLPIHASTQMTAAGPYDAKFLVGQGVSRIVLPRELSLGEIQSIKEESHAELEVFVHGALCYCYSGQCLLSSLYGGRSGNRGRCAQPCRLPYEVCDENVHPKSDARRNPECRKAESGRRDDGKTACNDREKKTMAEQFPLSLKDLCGIGGLDALVDAGVTSLKIEGRMKQLPYAAGVVSVYRRAIDGGVREGDMEELEKLGSRSGFTDRYFFARNGADMVTFEKPNYSCDEDEQKHIEEKFSGGAEPIRVKGKLRLISGERAEYAVMVESASVTILGDVVSTAKTKPLDPADVRARMEKTGGTDFSMDDVQIEMDKNAFLPNGELNRLRREALEQLREKMLNKYRKNVADCRKNESARIVIEDVNLVDELIADPVEDKLQSRPRIICLTENRKLIPILAERDFV